MATAVRAINPHISVDCVIFTFSDNQLKVLLIEREYFDKAGTRRRDHKLPGDFISLEEDLDAAAVRTLEELTGLRDIYLQQFAVFGNPDRISDRTDMEWLRETTGHEIHRVVTTAYYALIHISESKMDDPLKKNASWNSLHRIPPLAFDHEEIILEGLRHLQHTLRNEPIGFELLPDKFTIRELQNLYETILDCRFDNRNFRKKILRASYLVRLDEKEKGVAHKPASYYRFDREAYASEKDKSLGFSF